MRPITVTTILEEDKATTFISHSANDERVSVVYCLDELVTTTYEDELGCRVVNTTLMANSQTMDEVSHWLDKNLGGK